MEMVGAFLLVIAISYAVIFWHLFIVGAIAAIIGYACKKDVGSGLKNFFKSKAFIFTLLAVFCSGAVCALIDAGKNFTFFGIYLMLAFAAFIYLCVMLVYFIFKE